MSLGHDTWRIEAGGFPGAGTTGEKLQFLVNYAVLAPSKYNAQPWLFEICGDSLDLLCDRNWALRETDPQGRELTLSCGAALLNFTVAARHFGYAAEVQTFPWPGDKYLLARVRLTTPPQEGPLGPATAGGADARATSDQALFEAMNRRCTSRRSFRKRAPQGAALDLCRAAAARHGAWLHMIEDEAGRRAAAGLVARGDREQMGNRSLRRELARWLNGTGHKSRDGFPVSRYGLQGPMGWLAPGLSFGLWAFNLGNLIAARDRRLAERAPVLAVLGTDHDDPAAWLAAGQALELVLLHATAQGLSVSFFNQPVEVDPLRAQLGRVTGRNGFPQMLLRLGYSAPERHTPRRPAREVII